MQPSARQQDLERLYNARRGHVPHISISDDNYHVTEALGSYYGDEGPSSPSSPTAAPAERRDFRPLSYSPNSTDSVENASNDTLAARKSRRNGSYFEPSKRAPLGATQTNERLPNTTGAVVEEVEDEADRKSMKRTGSLGSEHSLSRGVASGDTSPHAPPSTPPLNRSPSNDTAIQQFPLNDIDYESSPAAVAQELSNLQAIRRMSMNVDAADPDLPSFSAGGLVPAVAPKRSEDENDAARLFWVPARLHPELAPREFKTFIEDRVDKIRRRSGDSDTLSPDSIERSGSDSSLRRKKSMLSHQIDTKGNYEDGAERLERKRSKGMSLEGQTRVELSELETLVSDPTQLMQRMSLEQTRPSSDSGVELQEGEDMPILPPASQSLKRSTRTTYRKGSLKKGERVPFAKRVQQRQGSSDAEDMSPQRSSFSAPDEPEPQAEHESEPILGLTRVQTEPVPQPVPSPAPREAFPPRQSSRRQTDLESPRSSDDLPQGRPSLDDRYQQRSPPTSQEEERQTAPPRPQPRQFQSRLASGRGRTTAQLPGYNNTNPLPNVVETLPDGTKVPTGSLISQIAERRASHDGPERKRSSDFVRPFQKAGAHLRPLPNREPPRSTLDDISSRPTMLPGSGGMGTDSLTMVPTFDEAKFEKKDSSRKSTWKSFFGGDDEERKAAKEDKANSDSSSLRSLKSVRLNRQQQPTEKARLDVLQNSIDGNVPSRGRESLVLNREDIKLDDGQQQQQQQQQQQRKKESKRTSESKKDKDSSLLSAIFGSKKKSLESESKEKKRTSKIDRTNISPEPIIRVLKPDIDYNWTRFSILEERAIYRMAHIKLANPRRALYSQVLLSNFMYSYLAKVQMMHPQVQIPAAHQRNQQGRGGQQKQEDQPAEYSQYQRWQQQQEREEAAASATSTGSPASSAAASGFNGQQVHPSDSQPAASEYDSEDFNPTPLGYELSRSSSDTYEYESSSGQQNQHQHQQHQHQQTYQPALSSSPPKTSPTRSTANGGGGGGYSVAGTHDYLGYPKDGQPFDSTKSSLWDDDDGNGEVEESLW